MLPVEKGKGQVWRRDQFLCDAEYDVGEPFQRNEFIDVQRVLLTVDAADCDPLLHSYDLTLVTASGKHYKIPKPFSLVGPGHLEIYIESAV